MPIVMVSMFHYRKGPVKQYIITRFKDIFFVEAKIVIVMHVKLYLLQERLYHTY